MGSIKQRIEQLKTASGIRMVIAVQKRYGEEGAGLLASAITYHAFFSVFPLILVGFSVIGFVLDDPDTQRRFLESAASSVPGLRSLLGDSVDAVVEARAATGVFGLVGLAWTGTQIVRVAGHALTKVFRIEIQNDNLIRSNAWAVGALLLLGTVAVAATGLSVLGSSLPDSVWVGALLVMVGAVADLGLFLIAYRILMRGKGPAFGALLPGALLATIGWTILKLLGSWYARKTVADAQAVYGTFAAAIGLQVMLSFGARLFMYGAILTVVRMREDPGLQTPVMEMEPTDEIPRSADEEVSVAMEKSNGQKSAIRLVRDIADDTRTLVRQEVELAKQEVTEAVTARLRGAIAFAIAGMLGVMVLIFGALAIEGALDGVMSDWAARLIVAGGLMVLAGLIALVGISRMKAVPLKPEETVRTVKEDVEWAKAQLKR